MHFCTIDYFLARLSLPFHTQCLLMQVSVFKRVWRPAAFAIIYFGFCELHRVIHHRSCAEQVVDFVQGMLAFVLDIFVQIVCTVTILLS